MSNYSDEKYLRIFVGSDLSNNGIKDNEKYLAVMTLAGMGSFKLSGNEAPFVGGQLSKKDTVKLRDFLSEAIKLEEEYHGKEQSTQDLQP